MANFNYSKTIVMSALAANI